MNHKNYALPPRLRIGGVIVDPIASAQLSPERSAAIGLPAGEHSALLFVGPDRQPGTLIARDAAVVELIEALDDDGPDDLAPVAMSLFIGWLGGWPAKWTDSARIRPMTTATRKETR